ncbi:MAG: hypothetical protein IJS94_06215, partial [Clostridia bacterium]|nr:hypothetical protein [Clostridia bacterium]
KNADADENGEINVTDYITVKRKMLGMANSGETDEEEVYVSTYVIYDPEGIKLENVCFKGKEAASLHEMLGKLSYSKDLICDCSPRYLLTFSNGDKYYIKYDYGFDDKIDGICKYTGSINEVQAMADERIKPYLDTVLEYAYNNKESGNPDLDITESAGEPWSEAETTATHAGGWSYPCTQICDPSATDVESPEPLRYDSMEEIPEEIKSRIKYIAKINDDDFKLSKIIISEIYPNYGDYYVTYFFALNDEEYYDQKTGYQISFSSSRFIPVDKIAANLEYTVDEDGTLFDPVYNLLYIQLEGSLCSAFYPKDYISFDKSVFGIYMPDGITKAIELNGFADPEKNKVTYISAAITSETFSDDFYFFKEYQSADEIPENLKKTLKYTVKLNDDSYIMNAVQVVISDDDYSRYYFRHESEADDYVWGKNGYDVEFHCNTDYTVERYAADYGKTVEEDGTYFEARSGKLFVQLDNGYCIIQYPEGYKICDKSVFSIYEFDGMKEVLTLSGTKKVQREVEPTVPDYETVPSEAGVYFENQTFNSLDEIPDGIKSILRYTAKLNDDSYKLVGIQLEGYNTYYYFLPESESNITHGNITHNNFPYDTGYFIKISRENWSSFEEIANHYGMTLDNDGTFLLKNDRIVFFPTETGYGYIKYPKTVNTINRSIFSIVDIG